MFTHPRDPYTRVDVARQLPPRPDRGRRRDASPSRRSRRCCSRPACRPATTCRRPTSGWTCSSPPTRSAIARTRARPSGGRCASASRSTPTSRGRTGRPSGEPEGRRPDRVLRREGRRLRGRRAPGAAVDQVRLTQRDPGQDLAHGPVGHQRGDVERARRAAGSPRPRRRRRGPGRAAISRHAQQQVAGVIPPGSGVPVPGANAGSSTSTSTDRNTGPSPTAAIASATTARMPRSRTSCMKCDVIPRSRLPGELLVAGPVAAQADLHVARRVDVAGSTSRYMDCRARAHAEHLARRCPCGCRSGSRPTGPCFSAQARMSGSAIEWSPPRMTGIAPAREHLRRPCPRSRGASGPGRPGGSARRRSRRPAAREARRRRPPGAARAGSSPRGSPAGRSACPARRTSARPSGRRRSPRPRPRARRGPRCRAGRRRSAGRRSRASRRRRPSGASDRSWLQFSSGQTSRASR